MPLDPSRSQWQSFSSCLQSSLLKEIHIGLLGLYKAFYCSSVYHKETPNPSQARADGKGLTTTPGPKPRTGRDCSKPKLAQKLGLQLRKPSPSPPESKPPDPDPIFGLHFLRTKDLRGSGLQGRPCWCVCFTVADSVYSLFCQRRPSAFSRHSLFLRDDIKIPGCQTHPNPSLHNARCHAHAPQAIKSPKCTIIPNR